MGLLLGAAAGAAANYDKQAAAQQEEWTKEHLMQLQHQNDLAKVDRVGEMQSRIDKEKSQRDIENIGVIADAQAQAVKRNAGTLTQAKVDEQKALQPGITEAYQSKANIDKQADIDTANALLPNQLKLATAGIDYAGRSAQANLDVERLKQLQDSGKIPAHVQGIIANNTNMMTSKSAELKALSQSGNASPIVLKDLSDEIKSLHNSNESLLARHLSTEDLAAYNSSKSPKNDNVGSAIQGLFAKDKKAKTPVETAPVTDVPTGTLNSPDVVMGTPTKEQQAKLDSGKFKIKLVGSRAGQIQFIVPAIYNSRKAKYE